MSSDFMLYVLLILCGLGGLSLATFIHIKKKLSTPLVCPIGHSCDPVVHSDYSRFLHMPVEILGMLYYLTILLAYAWALALPPTQTSTLAPTMISLSGAAFLFSMYLTGIQAFVLRQWCTWCLISAALCAAIFFLGLKASGLAPLLLYIF